ncbi:Hint domain-containing protein [Paracoccus stylophorae]|nr:Hint domain-containing protein [Paracoccus stylophorae]
MPYITEIPRSLITVNADGEIVFLPDTSLVNAFGPSQEFARYDVDATTGTTIENGDNIAPVDSSGDPLISGTYVGTATVSNAATSVGLPTIADITLQVNPLSGHIMQDDASGDYYFISDDPIDDDHLQVTASIEVAGVPISVTAPISSITDELADAVAEVPLAGPVVAGVIRGATGVIQTTANAAIVTIDNDSTGTLVLDDDEVVPCFLRGTLIETADGPVPVEDLRVGDLVLTKDHGLQPIRWRGCARLDAASLAKKDKLRPIRIRAGALGGGMPARDLLVSPQHRILVRSKIAIRMFDAEEVLIAAGQLLEVEGVEVDRNLTEVEYHHFLCDRHEVVLANGAAAEAMYTGDQALKAVGHAAREEIFTLFPELRGGQVRWPSARPIPLRRKARKLVSRHVLNRRELVF